MNKRPKPADNKSIIGNINSNGKDKIFGWAIDKSQKPLEIEILVNGKLVDTVPARGFRKDLQERGDSPDGLCGFALTHALEPLDYLEAKVKGKRIYLDKAQGAGLIQRSKLPETDAKIGIAVITYNRIKHLQKCIARIKQYTRHEYYLVVVDDGSQDGTAEWCKENNITVINGVNKGVSWNKNRAVYFLMNHTDCDTVLLLEDDCWPSDKDWARAWSYAANKFGHICDAHSSANSSAIVGGRGTAVDPYISKLATAPCTACSREALRAVGYLDPRFKGYGAAHVEWSIRFSKHYPIMVNGKAEKDVFLVMHAGLEEHDGPSFANKDQIAKNRQLRLSMANDPIYKDPWSSDAEKAELLQEMATKVLNMESVLVNPKPGTQKAHTAPGKKAVPAPEAARPSRAANLPRILFAHIPKTAGTSFRIGLSSSLSDADIVMDYGAKSNSTSGVVLENIYNKGWRKNLDKLLASPWKILFSHFHDTKPGLDGYAKAIENASLATIVRDPVQRIISEFFTFRNHYGYKESFHHFLTKPMFINRQCLSLGGIPLSSFQFVGITEHYTETLALFKALYGIDIQNNKANVRSAEDVTIGPDDIKMLCKLNTADIALYNEALHIFHRMVRDKPPIIPLSRFMGGYDLSPDGMVTGWAADYCSHWPVKICFESANAKVYETATLYRSDIKESKLHISGYCGFEISLASLKEDLGDGDIHISILNGSHLGVLGR